MSKARLHIYNDMGASSYIYIMIWRERDEA
jgi:hypothetical protein